MADYFRFHVNKHSPGNRYSRLCLAEKPFCAGIVVGFILLLGTQSVCATDITTDGVKHLMTNLVTTLAKLDCDY